MSCLARELYERIILISVPACHATTPDVSGFFLDECEKCNQGYLSVTINYRDPDQFNAFLQHDIHDT